MLKNAATFRRAVVYFIFIVCIVSGFASAGLWLALMFMTPGLLAFRVFPLLPLLMCVCTAMILATFTSRRVMRPFTELTAATKKVAKGDFSVRVSEEEAGSGEMGELIHSFNQMTEELGSTEMFREDFINNFSHEFKTPIVSIRGFARRLKNGNLSPEKQEEYLDFIVSESERLAAMSNNILLLTRYENQKFVGDAAQYYLDEQLRSAVLLLEDQWTKKNLSMEIDLPEILYYNNEEMMSHVWLNILNNAIKFTPEGKAVYISARADGGTVRVDIRDEGIGMSPRTAARVFDKFYQEGGMRSATGCGLGLALAKRIVELSGGTISVDSSPEMGSTFTVVLPLNDQRRLT